MTGDDKTSAFASWLRGRGVELTTGERSLVAGFIALAGREPVTAEHIAHGIELARGAAIGDGAQLEQLGAHLLAFEAAGASAAPPPLIALDEPPPAAGPPAAAIAPPGAGTPPGVSSPLQIMIRSTTRIATAAPPAGAEGERATTDEPDAAPPAAAAPRRWLPHLGRRARVATAGAVAAVAIAGAVYLRRDEPAPAPIARAAAPPVADATQRLRRVALGVRLPTGWREASEAELGAFTSRRDATVVFRGAAAADPEHGIFIAATAGRGDDLVGAARTAERGVIRQLGIDASAYHPAGCAELAMGGGPAARCRGVAERGASAVGVEIYVRVIAGRTVVALSLAQTSQATAASDAAAIVGSFTP